MSKGQDKTQEEQNGKVENFLLLNEKKSNQIKVSSVFFFFVRFFCLFVFFVKSMVQIPTLPASPTETKKPKVVNKKKCFYTSGLAKHTFLVK